MLAVSLSINLMGLLVKKYLHVAAYFNHLQTRSALVWKLASTAAHSNEPSTSCRKAISAWVA